MSEAKDKFFTRHLVVEGKDMAIFVRPRERLSNEVLSKLRRRFNSSTCNELVELIKKYAPEKLI
jgi:hypothetical protein